MQKTHSPKSFDLSCKSQNPNDINSIEQFLNIASSMYDTFNSVPKKSTSNKSYLTILLEQSKNTHTQKNIQTNKSKPMLNIKFKSNCKIYDDHRLETLCMHCANKNNFKKCAMDKSNTNTNTIVLFNKELLKNNVCKMIVNDFAYNLKSISKASLIYAIVRHVTEN